MADLSSGVGICVPTHRIDVRAVRAVIELGAVPDVVAGFASGLHHANRRSSDGGRIALALPDLRGGPGAPRAGHVLTAFGAPDDLDRLIGTDAFATLVRRGMVGAPEIVPVEPSGSVGTAFVRDRSIDRLSRGGRARAARRAERRGRTGPAPTFERTAVHEAMLRRPTVRIVVGKVPLSVMAVEGAFDPDAVLEVSSYGLTSLDGPGILPVVVSPAVLHAGAAVERAGRDLAA